MSEQPQRRETGVTGAARLAGAGRDETGADGGAAGSRASRRQRLAACLEAGCGEMHLYDVAGRLCAREAGTDPAGIDGAHRHRVAVALHHVHLPKLDDQGRCDYDPAARRVRVAGGSRPDAADGEGLPP